MLNIERENAILELLKQKETVKIKEIMKELNISEATARRDLSALEKRELVKRVHGGAILIEKNSFLKDLNVQYRKDICRDEKEKIAKFAASLVKDGSCIYLDAGTTSEKMIKYLKGKNIKIVTNGLSFIDENEKLKKLLLDMFDVMLHDNQKARVELPDTTYAMASALELQNDPPLNAQEYFYEKAYEAAEK
nr:DeoR family transcriptional regulator [uncultured Cetobacterium sp.]